MRLLKFLLFLPLAIILLIAAVAMFSPDGNYQIGVFIDAIPGGWRGLANYWYDRAARTGHVEAMTTSGIYYLFGFGPQDKEKGIAYLRRAAAKDNMQATAALSTACEWGLGREQDYSESYRLSSRVLELDPTATRSLYRIAYFKTICFAPIRDQKGAFEIYQNLFKEGDQEDLPSESLGVAYYFGNGVEPDGKKAFSFLEKAARLGSIQARALTGLNYMSGAGVEKNASAGFKWLELAARCGDLDSQLALYLGPHLKSSGFESYRDSEKWGEVLSKRGFTFHRELKSSDLKSLILDAKTNAGAQTTYGIMSGLGLGVARDEKLAEKYLLTAYRDHGSVDAGVLFANIVLRKSPPAEEMKESIAVLRSAYEDGHRFAGPLYASYVASGFHTRQNWIECFNILNKADLSSEPAGRFLLGQCYLAGLGVDQDVKKGLGEVLAAAKAGYSPSFRFLIDNYDFYDRDQRIDINLTDLAESASGLELPRVKYWLARRTPADKDYRKLLEESMEAGLLDAACALGDNYAVSPRESERLEAIECYRRAVEAGRLDRLVDLERLRLSVFGKQFSRPPQSKQIMRTTRKLSKGQLIESDCYEVVDSEDYIGDSYLDGSPLSVEILKAMHTDSEIDKGEAIATYNLGITVDSQKELVKESQSRSVRLFLESEKKSRELR